MIKKLTLVSVMVVLCTKWSMAQSNIIKPLSIGDTLPSFILNNVLNCKDSTLHLSDFADKLIILDFWATWCSSCIAGFTHADSLQKKFSNDIQIFLVNSKPTGDNNTGIISFFKNWETRTGLQNTLPIISEDSVLNKLFPHRYIPHYVWINKKGQFIATTSSVELTESNIESAISTNNFSGHIKKDQTNLNRRLPPFWKGNGSAGDSLIFRSLLTGYTEGINGASRRVAKNGLTIGLSYFNISLLDLYKSAYGSEYFQSNNRIILEVNNPELFIQPTYKDSLKYSHTYCYDITLPPCKEKQARIYMQEDLNRIFRVKVKNEKRYLKSIVLRVEGNNPKFIVDGYKPAQLDLETQSLHKYIYNYPLTKVLQLLNSYSPIPIISESNVKQNICLDLPYDLSDTKELIACLSKAGFKVTEQKVLMEVTVLKNISSQTN